MIRRPPRSTLSSSSAASDVYKRQLAWSCDGLPTSTMLGGSEIKKRTRSTNGKLEKPLHSPETTYKDRDPPGKRQRQRLSTDNNGVVVWQNLSTWMHVESRSRSRSRSYCTVSYGIEDDQCRRWIMHDGIDRSIDTTSGFSYSNHKKCLIESTIIELRPSINVECFRRRHTRDR